MAKNADGPISGRMGFGYRAHKEAGIPFQQRSATSAAIEMNEADARNKIRALLKEHPEQRDWAKRAAIETWPATNIYYSLIERINESSTPK